MRTFIGLYKAPELKQGQSFYCLERGHGACEKKVIEDFEQRVLTSKGEELSCQYVQAHVASCCDGELGIWDESGCDVPFDLIFEPAAAA